MAGEEELLGRQAPHSLEAEQSVLGAMLIDSRCVADVIGLLKPEDFYLQQNREIYETIYAMFNFSQVIDPVTVLDKMQERGVWQDASTEYIKQLMEITPTSANAVRYASIVRDKALLRGLATAASEISETVYEGVGTPAEILESAEKKIYALRKGERGESLEPISLVLHKVFDRLTELAQSDSDIPGLSTGLVDLDRKINGLNRSDLLLIAARPAMGKTSFALNIALNVAKKYRQTVAFSPWRCPGSSWPCVFWPERALWTARNWLRVSSRMRSGPSWQWRLPPSARRISGWMTILPSPWRK